MRPTTSVTALLRQPGIQLGPGVLGRGRQLGGRRRLVGELIELGDQPVKGGRQRRHIVPGAVHARGDAPQRRMADLVDLGAELAELRPQVRDLGLHTLRGRTEPPESAAEAAAQAVAGRLAGLHRLPLDTAQGGIDAARHAAQVVVEPVERQPQADKGFADSTEVSHGSPPLP
jgi:hypothetical protein